MNLKSFMRRINEDLGRIERQREAGPDLAGCFIRALHAFRAGAIGPVQEGNFSVHVRKLVSGHIDVEAMWRKQDLLALRFCRATDNVAMGALQEARLHWACRSTKERRTLAEIALLDLGRCKIFSNQGVVQFAVVPEGVRSTALVCDWTSGETLVIERRKPTWDNNATLTLGTSI